MRVVILYNAVSEHDSPEDRDVLVQAEVVGEALRQLGHEPLCVPCTLDLAAMRRRLEGLAEVVFNLVESLDGDDSLAYLAPAVLDAMRMPYTGNPTAATFLTAHKLLAKRWLAAAGLPTPAWLACGAGCQPAASRSDFQSLPEPGAIGNRPYDRPCDWIIKGVFEQGSRNLDEDAVVRGADADALRQHLEGRAARLGRACYAEQFIAGREFNIAVLDGPGGAEVLPPAEIDFSAFPPGKPRIVGYRAKWLADTFEFQNTPHRFDFPPEDQPLLDRLRELSLECWRLFELRGYARVDFRVDDQGRPWILEVNTNPCLSPDAGFYAALGQAKIAFPQAIGRILAACHPNPPNPLPYLTSPARDIGLS